MPFAKFLAITLLAPGGVRVGGVAGLYDSASVAKLGLDAQVQILDNRLVGVDRDAHEARLADGSTLKYECLLLCTGLQDQTRARLGIHPQDQVNYPREFGELPSPVGELPSTRRTRCRRTQPFRRVRQTAVADRTYSNWLFDRT
eukprot:5474433-Pyramimonas_sp.AAC.1